MGRPNLSRVTKFSGANGDRDSPPHLVQLTASEQNWAPASKKSDGQTKKARASD